jgi:hypothetical protein
MMAMPMYHHSALVLPKLSTDLFIAANGSIGQKPFLQRKGKLIFSDSLFLFL